MTAALTLAQRELVRFFRQPNRIVGAIGQPVLFWFLFGAAFKDSLRPPGVEQDYAQFFAPGVAAMIVLFTAIFSTISIIEDRREGFLQSVLVAPVPRSAIVLGKLLGGTLLAMLQALLFLTLVFATGKLPFGWEVVGPSLLILFLMGLALTGLGFCIAWRMDSTQGFHAIMSIFLLPMWLLSGSVFPVEGAATWLVWVMRLNPLTYGVEALRRALWLHGAPIAPGDSALLTLDVGVTVLFAVAAFAGATWIARQRQTRDLQ